MKKFLQALFKTVPEEKYIELRCIPANSSVSTVQYFFTKNELDSFESMAAALDARKAYHVCVGVLPRDQRAGTASCVSTLQALWVDIDAKEKTMKELFANIELYPIQPSIVVVSGHGYHCYWLLESALEKTPGEIKEIETRLHHITSADKTFDAGRVLRLPGTINCKDPENLCSCRVIRFSERRYKLEEILTWIQAVEKEEKRKADIESTKLTLKQHNSGEINEENASIYYEFTTWSELKRFLPQFLIRRILELPLHLRDEHGEKLDRSKNDFYVAASLLELGFTEAQVAMAFKIFADNGFAAGSKYRESGDTYLSNYTLPNAKKQVPYNIFQILELLESGVEEADALKLAAKALEIVKNTRAEQFTSRIESLVTKCTYMKKPEFLAFAQGIISGNGAYAFENFEISKKHVIIHKKIAETIVKDNPYLCVGTEAYRYENGVYVPDVGNQKLAAHIWAITENRPVGSSIGLEFGDLSDRTWIDLKQRDVQEICNYVIQNAYVLDPTQPIVAPDLICVKNGMVNWKTGELLPHSPKYFRLAQLDVMYNKDARSPVLNRFMDETFHPEDLPVIWEYMGVSILESTTAKKFMVYVGSGDNGKSVWLNTVRKVLGPDNISSATLSDLATNRFAKAQLLGKLANIAADISGGALDDIANIKELTGNDQTSADRKFQSQVNFVNKASLLFSCNVLPEAKAADDAYFRRLIIIECPNQVPENMQDKFLEAKLTTELSKSAWLNAAIDGLKRFFENEQTFTRSIKIEEAVQTHKLECRPDIAFIESYVVRKEGATLTIEAISSAMKDWMHATGATALLPNKSVIKALMAKTFPQHKLVSRLAGRPSYNDLTISTLQIGSDTGMSMSAKGAGSDFEVTIKSAK